MLCLSGFKLYSRWVPLVFGLKIGIHFAHFGLKLGTVFEGTTGA